MTLLLLACADQPPTESRRPADSCALGEWYADADGDGVGQMTPTEACDEPDSHVEVGGDCDDTDPTTYPGAPEMCDGTDNDCNGTVDDSPDATEWFADNDGDSFGAGQPSTSCDQPSGMAANDEDCDDDAADVHPGAVETPYDGVDQDCDGADLDDVDGDGSPYPDDCDDSDETRSPAFHELCSDEIDNNCSGVVDDDCQYFGGVVAADSAAVVYGERETVACCGSAAGTTLHSADFDGDGSVDLAMWSESEGTEFKVMSGPFTGESDTSGAGARLNRQASADGGYAVLATGDLSGDGIADLVIGEPQYAGNLNGGLVSVYNGPIGGWYGASDWDSQLEADVYARAGSALAIGDISGDGTMTLAVGVPHDSFWDISGSVVIAHADDGEALLSCSERPGIYYDGRGDLGHDLTLDDHTGDGVADIITVSAAPYDEDGNAISPFIALYSSPVEACIPHHSADAVVSFPDARGLDAANSNDPITLRAKDRELLFAAAATPWSGARSEVAAHLLSGPISGLSSASDAQAVITTVGNGEFERLVADFGGDIDGDGSDDYVFGLTEHLLSTSSGGVYVMFGPLSGTYVLEEDAFGVLEGSLEPFETCETDGCEHPGSLFGWTVVAGSDLTGDGHPDIAVGAPGFEHDPATNDKGPGAVWVYSGR